MQLYPEAPQQTPETWQEWARLSLPPNDLVFIQTAVWKKLTVGCRLASRQPTETACPLDRAQETMEHTLTQRRFLPTAFHLAVQCIGPIPHEGGAVVDPGRVYSTPSVVSANAVGTGVLVSDQSVVVGEVYAQVSGAGCTPILVPLAAHVVLSEWEEHPSPSLPKSEVTLLLHAFKTMDASTILEHPRVRVASDGPLPTLHQPARKKKKKFCTGSRVGRVYYTQSCGGWMVHCVPRWIITEAHRGGEGWGLWSVLWRSQGCGRVPARGRTTNQYQRGAPGSAPSIAGAHPRDPVPHLPRLSVSGRWGAGAGTKVASAQVEEHYG